MLDLIALGVIALQGLGVTALIVLTGALPGNIARKRNHPWPTAVTAAGWIGLATGILWPLALVWAFLPLPAPRDEVAQATTESDDENAKLRQRIKELESKVARMPSAPEVEA